MLPNYILNPYSKKNTNTQKVFPVTFLHSSNPITEILGKEPENKQTNNNKPNLPFEETQDREALREMHLETKKRRKEILSLTSMTDNFFL